MAQPNVLILAVGKPPSCDYLPPSKKFILTTSVSTKRCGFYSPPGSDRRGAPVAAFPLSLLVVDDLADGIHRLADTAANVALDLLGPAFRFQVAIAERLPGLLLVGAGCFLQAALNPL